MKAYWIVRCHVFEPGEFAKYVELAGPIINKFNGTFLTRGGKQIELEGEGYERTVLIEFNSFEEAKTCYHSEKYQHALEHIKKSAERLVVLVEGIS